MKRSAWLLISVVVFFIGLLVAYALVPSAQSGAKPAPAGKRESH